MKHYFNLFQVPNEFREDPLTGFLKQLTIVPNGFGHQAHDPQAKCGLRVMGDFELIYVVGGESVITVQQTEYHCRMGDAILIPPFKTNRIGTPADNPHENYWIHFDIYPQYHHETLRKLFQPHGGHMLHIGLDDELCGLYQLLERESRARKLGNMLFFQTIVVQILTSILRANTDPSVYGQLNMTLSSTETEIVKRSVDFVLNHIYEKICLDDVCAWLHISKPYLFRAFQKVLKVPPNHFIQLSKIKMAEQLVRNTAMPLNQIAAVLNYSSPYYFSNIFRRFYQMSPRDYRKVSRPQYLVE